MLLILECLSPLQLFITKRNVYETSVWSARVSEHHWGAWHLRDVEGVRFSWNGVSGGCESSNVNAGNQICVPPEQHAHVRQRGQTQVVRLAVGL